MNNDQTNAYLRTLLTFLGTSVGTYLVSHGYLDASQFSTASGALAALAGALATLGPIALSLYKTYQANTAKAKLTSVAAMPEVVKVDMVPSAQPLADSVPSSKVAVPAAKIGALLLACVLGSLFLGAPRAEAATAKIPARTVIANPLDPLGLLSKISSDIQPFITFFQTWTQDDLAAAVTLSTSIPSMPDPIGQACWQTFGSIGALVQAHPLPVTLKLASDIEALRLLRSGVKAVCGKPECNQVFADLANMANAINPMVPIPTLMSFCAKVP